MVLKAVELLLGERDTEVSGGRRLDEVADEDGRRRFDEGLDLPRVASTSWRPSAGVLLRRNVNFLELVAGVVLTHDALHPGEPLYIREALS